MVGGGSRRDDGPLGISNKNVFAALDSLRKKKKADSSKGKASSKSQPNEPDPQVIWAPTPLTVKSWADVDDDDDDYYATTAPPQPLWASSEQQNKDSSVAVEEESESEDDGLDEIDDDIEEEPEEEGPEHEPTGQEVPVEPVTKPSAASLIPKDSERQLSKKELKKKELAELDAVLAELGLSPKDDSNGQTETHGTTEETKSEMNGDAHDKEITPAPSESKASKKKKKKERASREGKEPQEQPNAAPDADGTDEASAEPAGGDTAAIDMKERLKKVASTKKKKSSKEVDSPAKAAAAEAATRSAKLAAAKKKEKTHYNQQPVR